MPPTAGWTLLAVDGSKANLPRTQDQETCFGIADNGACPQAFVTAVVEVHTKLLWDWRIDKATASEKTHLVEMAAGLPPSALLLADGNFVGYRIWSTLHHQQQPFLIRVGGNVHLLTQLWPEARIERRGDIVYAWPGQRQNKEAPLRLRLLKVGGASQPVYLLTNILDPRRLSRRSAGKIYRLRWGAELFYRAFKQTLGFTKLRSRSGGRGKIELEWALIACAVMTLLGINARRRADPRRLSPAGLLHTLRRSLLHGQPGSIRRLQRALAHCLRDCYQRHAPKASRHRPITRNTPKPLQLQAPNLRPATSHERKIAHETYPDLAA